MARKTLRRVLLATAWKNEAFAVGLARYAKRAGWHLDLQMHLSGELPRDWRGEGIIALFGGGGSLSRFVTRAALPTVGVSANAPQAAVPRVLIDSHALGRMAAEYLRDKGFRSFAWYSHAWSVVEQLRGESFAQSVEQAGCECAKLIWSRQQGKRRNTWANRQAWLARRIAKLPKPLAVFSVDDTIAVEVIEASLRAGLQIPDQVAVLGSGNLEVFRESTPLALSSVIVDFDRLAREAAALLEGLMAGEAAPEKPILIPPDGIAERRSTDTIAVEHPQVARAIRFMLDHYSEPIGVREIVASTAMSQTRLYVAFEGQLGKSPAAVLTRIRLEKARRMLRETDRKIHAIARSCGFGDSINLYRSFRLAHGISPKAYRASCNL